MKSRLYAPETEGGGGGGTPPPVSDKIKVGDKEYAPKDLEASISLYQALQDETTGREIIETLAKRAGLLDKAGEIKVKPGETPTQTENRVSKILKTKLGKDYDKFSDSVGPAFEEAINDIIEERLGARDAGNTQTNWNKSVDIFTNNHELTPEIEDAMKDLMEDAPPNFNKKNFDSQRYLARIYKNACEELGEAPKTKGNSNRRSRKDDDDDTPEIVIRDAPKGVTIDDAVEAAMKGIRFKKRD